eukprot:556482-Amphidinium_carterae.1
MQKSISAEVFGGLLPRCPRRHDELPLMCVSTDHEAMRFILNKVSVSAARALRQVNESDAFTSAGREMKVTPIDRSTKVFQVPLHTPPDSCTRNQNFQDLRIKTNSNTAKTFSAMPVRIDLA